MWPLVRSTCTFASLASANILIPMTIAAAAMTPRMEKLSRRIGSVRLPLVDKDGVQEQPEPDEGREEDHVAQGHDAAGEILEPVDHRDPAGHGAERRDVVRQEIRHQRI